jgi:hypothetical protein
VTTTEDLVSVRYGLDDGQGSIDFFDDTSGSPIERF